MSVSYEVTTSETVGTLGVLLILLSPVLNTDILGAQQNPVSNQAQE